MQKGSNSLSLSQLSDGETAAHMLLILFTPNAATLAEYKPHQRFPTAKISSAKNA